MVLPDKTSGDQADCVEGPVVPSCRAFLPPEDDAHGVFSCVWRIRGLFYAGMPTAQRQPVTPGTVPRPAPCNSNGRHRYGGERHCYPWYR